VPPLCLPAHGGAAPGSSSADPRRCSCLSIRLRPPSPALRFPMTTSGPTDTEVVTAPFGGSVTNVLVHEGDTVLPGTVIAIVADTRSLQVDTVDLGVPVSVALTVSSVALLPQATASGEQTYPVIISVSAMPPDVRAGMSVRVVLQESP
jgi:hypothetical protein